MPNIKIFQNQYPIPNIDNQRLSRLERDIQEARSRLLGKEPQTPQRNEVTPWWKRWGTHQLASHPASPQSKLDKIEARFRELDSIVIHYDELIQVLQKYRNDYISFFDRVSADVCLVIEDKAKRTQAIEQKRLAKQAQSRNAHTALLYQQQQAQIWNTVRKLSDAAILALKKLELFKTALLELADNHAQQKAVLIDLLRDTQDIRDAYELQKEINALEAEVNDMLEQSLNLEKLLEPYLGPFSRMIETVTRTDHKLADSVREIQILTDSILSDGLLSLEGSTEDKILDFLAHAQFSEQVVNYLADWDLSAIPPTEFMLQTPREANIEQALDNLQQFIKLRFPNAAQSLKLEADKVIEGELLLEQARERTLSTRETEEARCKREAEEQARKQREAEEQAHKQREAEEQAHKQREAEEQARKQREAEEQARKQREAEKARRKREAEEAERRRREGTRMGQYTAYDNGTVRDTKTGLMWMRCALGQRWDGKTCVGEASKMNWETACQQKGNGFAGYSDWRIPTIEELKTLADTSQSGAKIHPQAFPNCPASWFWSGSPVAYNSGYAWSVDFNYGNGYYGDRNDGSHVRLVRDGL